MVVQQMFKYRIYPSKKQKERLINNFKICKQIYNELLALNIDSWEYGGVSLNNLDYTYFLKGKFSTIYAGIRQNVSDRVHKAFQNFFRRVKDKSYKEKGFPRFKSKVNSIIYPHQSIDKRGYSNGYKFISNRRLHCSKIGNIPIILHRIPKGKIKTLTIKQNKAGQWFAIFSCEVDFPKVIHHSKEKIGIDVGIENFATLSNGEFVSNPKFLIKSEKRLKILHRRLSRKKKGSVNRRKAKFRLAKLYNKVVNQRTDFLHKLSRGIVDKYSFISVEDLRIANLVRNHCLAKSISDASWSNFIQMLSYKAVTSGGEVIKVNPRNTSRTCSNCGTMIDMPLSKRKFLCPNCHIVLHRDLNSSINILNGMVGLTKTLTPVDIEPLHSLKGNASSVVETGTICDTV